MTTVKERVFRYIQQQSGKGVTNAELHHELGLSHHQTAFYATHSLREEGLIDGMMIQHEWWFYPVDSTIPHPLFNTMQTASPESMTARQFEHFARMKMSEHFNTHLDVRLVQPPNKRFDLVSEDESIIGDAKYYTLVRGSRLPPAKFAVIAEHVWLLEKTDAQHKFLVFGNDRRVPQMWLAKYGPCVSDVVFYFLTPQGAIEQLR
jgi:hypothetical protein